MMLKRLQNLPVFAFWWHMLHELLCDHLHQMSSQKFNFSFLTTITSKETSSASIHSSMFQLSVSALYLLYILLLSAALLVCSAPSNGACLEEERKALLKFKHGLVDPENRLSSWQGHRCCGWQGITCDSLTGTVIGIDLHNPYAIDFTSQSPSKHGFWNLSGILDPSLLQLKSLGSLDLSFNTFRGIPIPEFVGSIETLGYLNLSNAEFSGVIPAQLGNLSRLQYLDLSSSFPPLVVDDFDWISGLSSLVHLAMDGVDLSMTGTKWIHSLNRLSSLTELHLKLCSLSGIIPSLSSLNFTRLAVIDLSHNSLNSTIPSWLLNLTSLVHLDMNSAGLQSYIPIELSSLPRLQYLDFSMNNDLSADCSLLLSGTWSRIEYLYLAMNQVFGKCPASIGNITSLVELSLFSNAIEGSIPSSIGKLCNLQLLSLAGNNFTLGLPQFLDKASACSSNFALPNLTSLMLGNNRISGFLPQWLGELRKLKVLDLGFNSIQGPIPSSLGNLKLLTDLSLEGNSLNGSLPPNLGQVSKLINFDISQNQLTGTVTEAHFTKLTNLKILSMSSNSLVFNVSSSWVPPFRVRNLMLSSCQLGPGFPSWLENQTELQYLDLSNARISGKLPPWFWDLSPNLSLLNISFNQVEGLIPNPIKTAAFSDIDMRSNLLTGPLPPLSNVVELLDLSHNNFSGSIPPNIGDLQPYIIYLSLSDNNINGEIPKSIGMLQGLEVLDLSSNDLTGSIPFSLQNCSYLKALGLENNMLSGPIPASLGMLKQLKSLHLNNNRLSGTIPPPLQNCSSLETLDLGGNFLTGSVPVWLGSSLPALRILVLRSNVFSGPIPPQISNLSSLQILDLADNNLEGPTPPSFGSFQAMIKAQKANEYLPFGFDRGNYYQEHLSLHVSNKVLEYTRILSLVTSIDLSRNNLSGQFPETLTKLAGLLVLDLSNNRLSGNIPRNINNMHSLFSFDISNNTFSGSIPSSMSSMIFLGHLNLSNNNFSGEIPARGQLSTFDASAFAGNRYLCGTALPMKCQTVNGDAASAHNGHGENYDDGGDGFGDEWFCLSVELGFAVGILGLFGVVSIRKTWIDAYFGAVDRVVDEMLKVNHVIARRRNGRRRPGR